MFPTSSDKRVSGFLQNQEKEPHTFRIWLANLSSRIGSTFHLLPSLWIFLFCPGLSLPSFFPGDTKHSRYCLQSLLQLPVKIPHFFPSYRRRLLFLHHHHYLPSLRFPIKHSFSSFLMIKLPSLISWPCPAADISLAVAHTSLKRKPGKKFIKYPEGGEGKKVGKLEWASAKKRGKGRGDGAYYRSRLGTKCNNN